MKVTADLSGATVANCQIHERLGAGGMAVVYRAILQPLGREVALKALAPSLISDQAFLQRFELEAKTLARLDHPNILPIYDFVVTPAVIFITMPLLRQGTLRDILDRGPLDGATAWRYLQQVGQGLQHTHEAGIVHRDPGLPRLQPAGSAVADWYFEAAMQAAREAAGSSWSRVQAAANLDGVLLKGHVESLDAMRGEPAHAWREVDPNRYWVVHYKNPFVLGRHKKDKACHFWIGSYQSLLRWAGLANDWLVDEVECGAVTGSGDCVFAIRSVKA